MEVTQFYPAKDGKIGILALGGLIFLTLLIFLAGVNGTNDVASFCTISLGGQMPTQSPFAVDDDWWKLSARLVITGRSARELDKRDNLCVFQDTHLYLSFSLFSIAVAKFEGFKPVGLGGKKNVKQRCCGTSRGQSIDSEIKNCQ
ncbi:hypothetical protein BJ912DRAFT_123799 [Pholiota molesta]|nr:hypothetical protein BJ912DRAFT_123799 [Pholiota molesta]